MIEAHSRPPPANENQFSIYIILGFNERVKYYRLEFYCNCIIILQREMLDNYSAERMLINFSNVFQNVEIIILKASF